MVNGEEPLLRNSRRQRRVEGSDRRHKRRPIIPAISYQGSDSHPRVIAGGEEHAPRRSSGSGSGQERKGRRATWATFVFKTGFYTRSSVYNPPPGPSEKLCSA